MKKFLLLTAIVTITFFQSTQKPHANQNSNDAGNLNTNRSAANTDEDKCEELNGEKMRIIYIDPGPTGKPPKIRTPINFISITKGMHSVNWCINNTTSDVINVVIAHLHEKKVLGKKNPFGPNGEKKDNTFVTMAINPTKVKNLRTKTAYKSGTYEYDVLLFDANWNPIDFLDPQVIIGEGGVGSGNRNGRSRKTNTNSNKNR